MCQATAHPEPHPSLPNFKSSHFCVDIGSRAGFYTFGILLKVKTSGLSVASQRAYLTATAM